MYCTLDRWDLSESKFYKVNGKESGGVFPKYVSVSKAKIYQKYY